MPRSRRRHRESRSHSRSSGYRLEKRRRVENDDSLNKSSERWINAVFKLDNISYTILIRTENIYFIILSHYIIIIMSQPVQCSFANLNLFYVTWIKNIHWIRLLQRQVLVKKSAGKMNHFGLMKKTWYFIYNCKYKNKNDNYKLNKLIWNDVRRNSHWRDKARACWGVFE